MVSAFRAALFETTRILATMCALACAACSGSFQTPLPRGTTGVREALTPTPLMTSFPTPMAETTAAATLVSEPNVLGFERSIPMGFQGIEIAAQSLYGGGIRIAGSAEAAWIGFNEPDEGHLTLRGWSRDGCHLVVGLDHAIGLINSDGRLERIEFRERGVAPSEHISDEAISPDMTWVAYIVGRGQQEYLGYEWQDVETAPIGNEGSSIYRLTTAGRTWEPAWSPVENLLAFGDANEAGAPILVVTSPTGERRTVLFESSHTGGEIRDIRWSPTGERLAFEVLDSQENKQVWLASIDGGSEPLIMNVVAWIHDFWWQDAVTLGLYATPRASVSSQPSSSFVYWYNVVDHNQVGQLAQGSTVGQEIIQPGPLNAGRIGFFSGSKFVAYDFPSGESMMMYPRYEDGVRWYSKPDGVEKSDCS